MLNHNVFNQFPPLGKHRECAEQPAVAKNALRNVRRHRISEHHPIQGIRIGGFNLVRPHPLHNYTLSLLAWLVIKGLTVRWEWLIYKVTATLQNFSLDYFPSNYLLSAYLRRRVVRVVDQVGGIGGHVFVLRKARRLLNKSTFNVQRGSRCASEILTHFTRNSLSLVGVRALEALPRFSTHCPCASTDPSSLYSCLLAWTVSSCKIGYLEYLPLNKCLEFQCTCVSATAHNLLLMVSRVWFVLCFGNGSSWARGWWSRGWTFRGQCFAGHTPALGQRVSKRAQRTCPKLALSQS